MLLSEYSAFGYDATQRNYVKSEDFEINTRGSTTSQGPELVRRSFAKEGPQRFQRMNGAHARQRQYRIAGIAILQSAGVSRC